MIFVLNTQFSLYHLFRISCLTMIIGKESLARERGLFSVVILSSVSMAWADWMYTFFLPFDAMKSISRGVCTGLPDLFLSRE